MTLEKFENLIKKLNDKVVIQYFPESQRFMVSLHYDLEPEILYVTSLSDVGKHLQDLFRRLNRACNI